MTDPLLVGVREAAQRLGIGRDATYELRIGRLRSISVAGRRVLIPRCELEDFIEREVMPLSENGTEKEQAPTRRRRPVEA